MASVEGRITVDTPRKITTAIALFEQHVDGEALLERLAVTPSDAVTPLMFEHTLLDRARSERRHIVLPEGTDERILRAAETLLRRRVADLTLLGDEDEIRGTAAQLGSTSQARGCCRHPTRSCTRASPRNTRIGARRRASRSTRRATWSATCRTSAP